jgi:cardiolipin synthase (CMP-forming)
MMIPFFVLLIYFYGEEHQMLRTAALGVYALAAISDGLDGYVARKFNQRTKLGARLDPLADKLMVNLGLVFIAANPYFHPPIPMWFPVVVLSRDVLIVMGAYFLNERHGPLKVKPLWSGKFTTAFQMGTLIAALLALPITNLIMWIALVFTIISLVQYVSFGRRIASAQKAV